MYLARAFQVCTSRTFNCHRRSRFAVRAGTLVLRTCRALAGVNLSHEMAPELLKGEGESARSVRGRRLDCALLHAVP